MRITPWTSVVPAAAGGRVRTTPFEGVTARPAPLPSLAGLAGRTERDERLHSHGAASCHVQGFRCAGSATSSAQTLSPIGADATKPMLACSFGTGCYATRSFTSSGEPTPLVSSRWSAALVKVIVYDMAWRCHYGGGRRGRARGSFRGHGRGRPCGRTMRSAKRPAWPPSPSRRRHQPR
jgi:hypothetical protein